MPPSKNAKKTASRANRGSLSCRANQDLEPKPFRHAEDAFEAPICPASILAFRGTERNWLGGADMDCVTWNIAPLKADITAHPARPF